MSKVDDIMDVLGRHGVHEGWPEERRTMATQLSGHGWSPDDVDDLCESIAKASRNPGAAAASVLGDLKDAYRRLQDIRKCRENAPQAAVARPAPVTGDRSRQRRIAWALVEADGKSHAEACDVLGVCLDELNTLMDEERQLRQNL